MRRFFKMLFRNLLKTFHRNCYTTLWRKFPGLRVYYYMNWSLSLILSSPSLSLSLSPILSLSLQYGRFSCIHASIAMSDFYQAISNADRMYKWKLSATRSCVQSAQSDFNFRNTKSDYNYRRIFYVRCLTALCTCDAFSWWKESFDL